MKTAYIVGGGRVKDALNNGSALVMWVPTWYRETIAPLTIYKSEEAAFEDMRSWCRAKVGEDYSKILSQRIDEKFDVNLHCQTVPAKKVFAAIKEYLDFLDGKTIRNKSLRLSIVMDNTLLSLIREGRTGEGSRQICKEIKNAYLLGLEDENSFCYQEWWQTSEDTSYHKRIASQILLPKS